MMKSKGLVKALAALTACFLASGSALAQNIVYDNSTTFLEQFHAPGNEIEFGDEIFLDGLDRIITEFKFEYFASDNLSGNEMAEISFRLNDDGTFGDPSIIAPGTAFYQSGEFEITPGFQTVTISAFPFLVLPDTFTWTVRFSGLEGTEEAGLLLYDPPTVGSSFDDFWENTDDGWKTFVLEGTPVNFAAQISAIPEPSTYLYALMSGLAFLGFRSFRRRSS